MESPELQLNSTTLIQKIKPILRIRFSEDYFLSPKLGYFAMSSEQQFFQHFLPDTFDYQIVPREAEADICIVGIHTPHGHRASEFNLLISIENYAKWPFYEHRNIFGDFGDQTISAYYYAHYSEIQQVSNSYLIIPTVHAYIRHFLLNYNSPKSVDISNRKFGLMTNRSRLNPAISNFVNILEAAGYQVDSIQQHNFRVAGKSCYQSSELLSVFAEYKFILCIENSHQDGYITEKIFNCFSASTIPLYLGAPDIEQFINPEAYVDLRQPNWIDMVKNLDANPEAYLKMLNAEKVVPGYDRSFSYLNLLSDRIQQFLDTRITHSAT